MFGSRTILTAVILSCVGCANIANKTRSSDLSFLRGDPPQVRERLLERIPIGTSRSEAEQSLTSFGFEIPTMSNLSDESSDTIQGRRSIKHRWMGETTWLVQVEFRQDRVADIFCEKISVGGW